MAEPTLSPFLHRRTPQCLGIRCRGIWRSLLSGFFSTCASCRLLQGAERRVLALNVFHGWMPPVRQDVPLPLSQSQTIRVGLLFFDNDGVLHAIMNGGGGGPEAYECIGRLWLELAKARVDLRVGRVKSGSNPADGPTQDHFVVLQRMKAQWVLFCLPTWAQTFWQGPAPLW